MAPSLLSVDLVNVLPHREQREFIYMIMLGKHLC